MPVLDHPMRPRGIPGQRLIRPLNPVAEWSEPWKSRKPLYAREAIPEAIERVARARARPKRLHGFNRMQRSFPPSLRARKPPRQSGCECSDPSTPTRGGEGAWRVGPDRSQLSGGSPPERHRRFRK